ncbi:unnamed protein product [Echinostoma caproni]|uniref:Secreted protein n=1 Tax=Echinostoma caproni TaxID=27848 RepID=A0A183B3S5_9TREM|nr:unnamed protein product [Echinostoma caproni]
MGIFKLSFLLSLLQTLTENARNDLMLHFRSLSVVKHMTQQIRLEPKHFLQLANFLGQLANWSQRLMETNIDLCVFCRNNNEPFDVYTSHKGELRDMG